MNENEQFYSITPDVVLTAAEDAGFVPTGRVQQLNSFENRVYEIEIEDPERPVEISPIITHFKNKIVAKFYRPGRWSKEQILEEHQFLQELTENEVQAIPAIRFLDGSTVHKAPDTDIFYCLYPKVGGRAPDELAPEDLEQLGRLVARIHNVGEKTKAVHRIKLNHETYGLDVLKFLKSRNTIPPQYLSRYENAVKQVCAAAAPLFAENKLIRCHGDCHPGNILWNVARDGKTSAFFLDFDDMVIAPAIQDIWMILPGRDIRNAVNLDAILEGYSSMRSFNMRELKLAELLRALRIIHFTGWIAKRWSDPSFPRAFPSFNSNEYWEDEIRQLDSIVQKL